MMLLGKHDESIEKRAAQRPSDDDGADDPGSGLFGPMRRRWDLFQVVRGSLQFVGFVLVTIGIAVY